MGVKILSTCKQRPLEPLTARQGGSPAILQRAVGPLKEGRCERKIVMIVKFTARFWWRH